MVSSIVHIVWGKITEMNTDKITIGILAHGDAGKTTLAESLLYKTGVIRAAGRVDHKDAHLDTHVLEKERGITIFSKQAQIPLGDMTLTLLDTPGHVDFSAEMERTLQVLDYALLLISASDGITGHVLTLWKLLKRYGIPVFIFINKMDLPSADKASVTRELKEKLDGSSIELESSLLPGGEKNEELLEEIATCDEAVMEKYLSGEAIDRQDVTRLIRERKLFPCFYGSALRMEGVDRLLEGMCAFMQPPVYPDAFSARVFRISREGSTRLTHLKVTGGTLPVRMLLDEEHDEKADQIRLYSGSSFTLLQEAPAGTVAVVTGLTQTRAGDVLGERTGGEISTWLEPVMTSTLMLPEGADVHMVWQRLKLMEEEIPEMHLSALEEGRAIQVQIMGDVQTEILKALILERTGMEVGFAEGRIVYKETIGNTVECVGHFEPLRHYAEVHLIMEPSPPGSGVTFSSLCPTDELDLNWQRLIRTHVEERNHPGVLTGAPLTDVHITLTAGKAHLKHTQGGDFRQAVYRALRQGLMQAKNVLLEPFCQFQIELPVSDLGRALSDIQFMGGNADAPVLQDQTAVVTGTAPVAGMQGYPRTLQGYTGGNGRIFMQFCGYMPCHNAREVIEEAAYDPDTDKANPSGSVFCSHGAGMYVPWYQVGEYMHLESTLEDYLAAFDPEEEADDLPYPIPRPMSAADRRDMPAVSDSELMKIFENTFSANSRHKGGGNRRKGSGRPDGGWKRSRLLDAPVGLHKPRPKPNRAPVLIVDGYNVIYDWDELRAIADDNLDGARNVLQDILCNYQGFRQMMLIVVFDAYKVAGGRGEAFDYHNIHVVFTREAQTADAYIERFVHEKASSFDVTVATSDGAQQLIVWGEGARRMSARELKEEIIMARRQMQDFL